MEESPPQGQDIQSLSLPDAKLRLGTSQGKL